MVKYGPWNRLHVWSENTFTFSTISLFLFVSGTQEFPLTILNPLPILYVEKMNSLPVVPEVLWQDLQLAFSAD